MNTEPTPTMAAVGQPRLVMLFQFDGMLWSRCKLRKTMPDYWGCAQIPKGKFAYRPLTNGYDRMKRLKNVPTKAIILAER